MRTKEEISKELKKLQKKVAPSQNRSRQECPSEKSGSTGVERDQSFQRMGSWELDLSSGILHCSPDVKDILKFGEDKKYSLNDYLEKIHPDDRRTFLKEIERTTTEKTSFTQKVRYLQTDGKIITALPKGEPR